MGKKKHIALISILIAIILVLTSCYAKVVVLQEAPKTESVKVETTVSKNNATKASDSSDIKVGVSAVASLKNSKDGLAQSDVTLVAVALDENGVITDCRIDEVQSKVSFDENGLITTDLSSRVPGKMELGDKYGMRVASSIGKEWNEQLQFLSEYVVGKTIDDVKHISVSPKNSSDVDLASSVTVYIGSFLSGIEKAAENATYSGAKRGDELLLVTNTSLTNSKNATADSNGLVQMDTDFAVFTISGDKITSSYFDGVQAKVSFDKSGHVVSDTASSVPTKIELGDAYNMKMASKIGQEWYQQSGNFSEYIKGRSVDEVLNISIDKSTKPTDADLSSSVTMSIGGFLNLVSRIGK